MRFPGPLEGKGLVVLEGWASVEAEAGNAANRELNREDIALFASWKVRRCLVDGRHDAIRKRVGVEARGLLRVLVKPQTDGVLGLHAHWLLGDWDFMMPVGVGVERMGSVAAADWNVALRWTPTQPTDVRVRA
jgi:hypothetical protein